MNNISILALLFISTLACGDTNEPLNNEKSHVFGGGMVRVADIPKRTGVEERQIDVVATLKEFRLRAGFDDFEDGTSISYDLSVFIVKQPHEFNGRKLLVEHDHTPGLDSPWRREGKIFILRLNERFLDEGASTYGNSEAIKIVKEL